ncbi:pentatricopeptide repeat-containing protein At5g39710-like [Lotus japonicus]|uniref:pentatricopeptide repeat-containing protein At5g39710-like n=1 Tax=Lotus japonicus TaxID=34305 RepID=UPI002585224A|nr:pentatricopeptide repeat-containing protein At5g39710-like [Lotus japonicus]
MIDFDLFCDRYQSEKAYKVLREMIDRGFSPSVVEYNKLIDSYCSWGYCQTQDLVKVFEIKKEMLQKGFLLDADNYSMLLHSQPTLSEAFDIFQEMLREGVEPMAYAYVNLMDPYFIPGFYRIGELRKAYDLKLEMDEMLQSGDLAIQPLSGTAYWSLMGTEGGLLDEANYTSVINAYCADGEVVKARTLLNEVCHFIGVRESVIYDVLISGLDKKARTREAKKMLLSLIYHLCTTSWPTLTFDTLIENCSNNEFMSLVELVKGFRIRDLENEAASVLNTMLQGNYKPDGAVYNFLIVEHCRCKNVDKAYDMYMEMVQCGFAPHMFSVLALIKTLYYGRRYNEMSWVIENTLRSCNLNDSELHKLLNEIGVRKGEFKEDALFNVLAEIAMDGLLLNGGKCSYAPASA